jgi:hypothetical protein
MIVLKVAISNSPLGDGTPVVFAPLLGLSGVLCHRGLVAWTSLVVVRPMRWSPKFVVAQAVVVHVFGVDTQRL